MWFISWICNALGGAGDLCYDVSYETSGWVWPFYYVSNMFSGMGNTFYNAANYFSYFGDWCYDVWDRVTQILSWDNIWNLIKQYAGALLYELKGLWDWWWSIWSEINTWWSAASTDVHNWINAAVGGLQDIAGAWSNFWNYQWPQLTSRFDSLKSSWDNFWAYTFPSLVSQIALDSWWSSRLRDVQWLINTAVRDAGSLAEGWQDMRANVVTFFQDPVEFIWQRFANWFLGPEG